MVNRGRFAVCVLSCLQPTRRFPKLFDCRGARDWSEVARRNLAWSRIWEVCSVQNESTISRICPCVKRRSRMQIHGSQMSMTLLVMRRRGFCSKILEWGGFAIMSGCSFDIFGYKCDCISLPLSSIQVCAYFIEWTVVIRIWSIVVERCGLI